MSKKQPKKLDHKSELEELYDAKQKIQKKEERKKIHELRAEYDRANPESERGSTIDYERARNHFVDQGMKAYRAGNVNTADPVFKSRQQRYQEQLKREWDQIGEDPEFKARANGFTKVGDNRYTRIGSTGYYTQQQALGNPEASTPSAVQSFKSPRQRQAEAAAAKQGAAGVKTAATAQSVDFNSLTPNQQRLAKAASGMAGANQAFNQYTNNLRVQDQSKNAEKHLRMVGRLYDQMRNARLTNDDGTMETDDQIVAKLNRMYPQRFAIDGNNLTAAEYIQQNNENEELDASRAEAAYARNQDAALSAQKRAEYESDVRTAQDQNAFTQAGYDAARRNYENNMQQAQALRRQGNMPIMQNGQVVNGDRVLDTSGQRDRYGRLISSTQIDRMENRMRFLSPGQRAALMAQTPTQTNANIQHLMNRSADLVGENVSANQKVLDEDYAQRDPSGQLAQGHRGLMENYNLQHTPDGTIGYLKAPEAPQYVNTPERVITDEERRSADNVVQKETEAENAERKFYRDLSKNLVPTFTKKEQKNQAAKDLAEMKKNPEMIKAARAESAKQEAGKTDAGFYSALARWNNGQKAAYQGEGEYKDAVMDKGKLESMRALKKDGWDDDTIVAHVFGGQPLPERDKNGNVIKKGIVFTPEYWEKAGVTLFGEDNVNSMDEEGKTDLRNALTDFGKEVAKADITDLDSLQNADLNTLRDLDLRWNTFVGKNAKNKTVQGLASPFRDFLMEKEAEAEQADYDEHLDYMDRKDKREGRKDEEYWGPTMSGLNRLAENNIFPKAADENEARNMFFKTVAPNVYAQETKRAISKLNTSPDAVLGGLAIDAVVNANAQKPNQKEIERYNMAKDYWEWYGSDQFRRAKNIANRKKWVAANSKKNGKKDPVFTVKKKNQ